jgi:pimeloyl-ACP methyl ester carboxylesterase
MTSSDRANGALAALLAVVLISACSPDVPSPSAPPATADPSATTSAAPAPTASGTAPAATPGTVVVPPAHWSSCGKGFLCADIRVPRDYAAPTHGYVNVSIIDLPATDRKARIGSLVINPGGPGGSGVEFVRDALDSDLFGEALRERFDIVGFDPRGVNSSTAVRCIDNLDGRAEVDPSPDNATELKALIKSERNYAKACAQRNEALLPYLSTENVARDLDLIRSAIGDDKLTYLGFSYGTLIGSTYADMFPDHIRAMVLDGAIDPALDLKQSRLNQAKAFDAALANFLKDCAARTTCAFHEGGRTAQAFDSLMARIDAKPLPAVLFRGTRRIGPGIAWYAVLASLYSRDSWPALANALALAQLGDGSLMLLINDPFRGRKPNGSYSNAQDSYTANTCLDYQALTDVNDYTPWAKQLKAAAPRFGPLLAYNDLACTYWPVAATRIPKAATAKGAPPIVVVGSTGDPATPYSEAVSLAKELDTGVLITRKGEGHTGYGASECVQEAVDEYLMDLTVPHKGLTCNSD